MSNQTKDQLYPGIDDALIRYFEHLQDAAIICTPADVGVYANPASEKLYGYKSTELQGKEVLKLLTAPLSVPLAVEMLSDLRAGKNVSGELLALDKDKNTFPVRITGSPLYDHEGKLIGVAKIITSIVQQKINEEMLYFLSKAGEELSASLDYDITFDKITSLIVPKLADWFVIDSVEDSGESKVLAIAHKDPEKVKWAYEYRKQHPVDMNMETGVAGVIKTGKPEIHPFIPDEMLVKLARNEEHLDLLRSIGFRSLMTVPLTVRGRTKGAISFITTSESNKLYTNNDLVLASEFAKRVALAIENVTLYQQAKQELEVRRRTEEKLDNLVGTIPGIVWELKKTGSSFRITFISDYIEKMLGYTVKEVLENPEMAMKIMHPEDLARKATGIATVTKKGSVIQYRCTRKDGKTIWVEAHFIAISDSDGNTTEVRGVTMDISASRELDKKKDEFLSIASHELKTPLTSVKAYVQLALRQLTPDAVKSTGPYLEKANIYIERLGSLIAELLDVSKIQAGKMKFNFSEVEFNDLVRESIDNMQHTTNTHKIVLAGKASCKVSIDKQRVEQVLINFISNAVKYSPKASEVHVSLTCFDDHVQVAVKDFGIGISQENQQKIFTRFFRVEENEHRFAGLGIGLYISSEIIHRHGGRVWVESEPGKGSTFYFTLPKA